MRESWVSGRVSWVDVCIAEGRSVVVRFENGLAHEFPLHAQFYLIQPK